eukprot:COSAG01_NODE_6726_length_3526_cov_68.199883_3_plen_169_part_00
MRCRYQGDGDPDWCEVELMEEEEPSPRPDADAEGAGAVIANRDGEQAEAAAGAVRGAWIARCHIPCRTHHATRPKRAHPTCASSDPADPCPASDSTMLSAGAPRGFGGRLLSCGWCGAELGTYAGAMMMMMRMMMMSMSMVMMVMMVPRRERRRLGCPPEGTCRRACC